MDGDHREMLDPCNIIPAIRITHLERGTIAGRQALIFTAVPRDIDNTQPEVLWPGADDYELAVDAVYGVLLKGLARLNGSPMGKMEVLSVRFNEAIPDDVFIATGPNGTPNP